MELIKPGTKIDFVGRQKIFGIISIALCVLALVLVFTRGLNYGIDFRGGTEVQLKFSEAVSEDQVRTAMGALKDLALSKTVVQSFGDPEEHEFLVKIDKVSFLTDDLRQKICQALAGRWGQDKVLKCRSTAEGGDVIEVRFKTPQLAAAPAAPKIQLKQQGGQTQIIDFKPGPGGTIPKLNLGSGGAPKPKVQVTPAPAGGAATAAPAAAPAPAEAERKDLAQDGGGLRLAQAETRPAAAPAAPAAKPAAPAASPVPAKLPVPGVLAEPTAEDTAAAPATAPAPKTAGPGGGPDEGTLTDILAQAGVEHLRVSRVGKKSRGEFRIALQGLAAQIQEGLSGHFGEGQVEVLRVDAVGPKVGEKLRNDGILAIVYALIGILLYIGLRFDLKFAPGAVAALVHDVLITIGIFSILGKEFTLSIIAALLTIVGYSLNDTIVVFDRIRENVVKLKGSTLETVTNRSINETLSRTLLTSLTTLVVVVTLFIYGGGIIHDFAFAMIVGVLVGTYSSIFVASPIVLHLNTLIEQRAGRR